MVIQNSTSLELVKRMIKDDVNAFEELYSKSWEQLFIYSVNKLKSEDEAKDIVQDVFVKLWEKRKTIVIKESVEAYLQTIAKYEILDKISKNLRHEATKNHYSKYVLPEFIELFDPVQLQELELAIDKAVNDLPPQLKEVHRLSKKENLSIKEIASRLNTSEQTVKNQLTTSTKRLRISLKGALPAIVLTSQIHF